MTDVRNPPGGMRGAVGDRRGAIPAAAGVPHTYRILGELQVRFRGRRVEVPGGNTLNLLAVLLLNANALVPADVLVERMWGDRPPRTARAVLQNCVSRLRSLVDPAKGGVPLPIVTGAKGYSLRVPHGALDLHRFDGAVADADEAVAAGRDREAADLLHRALSLWQNEVLPDVTAPGAHRVEIRLLYDHRTAVLDRWADLELAAGQAHRVIPELRTALAARPAAERLRYQLVRALTDNQQIGEASRVLRETEDMLRDRYGLDARPVLERWWRQLVTSAAGDGVRWPPVAGF
ncbi:AfsR/SARP family transcriptional regulator [Umezawaea tangerina]|uniref:DNA-binding SARP family transcriptional activator n=1 Tax=Umezawaea tangerina TaxID=84725 RepID=A0A2T0SVT0_9PSEU|nr:BTAD domain-containing putative transcriptional regulator [Umezawaea tangerina]PRY37500.1 DNA-binding SARP family transcriptional activator [Umezawaea tangerina]